MLTIASLVVALALLWTGVKKLSWSSPLNAVLSCLDLLALGLLVVSLGWWGLGLFLLANFLAFVGYGIAGAIYVEAEVAAASARANVDKAEIEKVVEGLKQDKRLALLGPRRRANLVRLLADRARDPEEIAEIAPPVGLLYIIGEPRSLLWLVERFDVILRLFGHDADEAMEVADVLTAGTQNSAATLEEMIEASVVAGGGSPSVPPLETG